MAVQATKFWSRETGQKKITLICPLLETMLTLKAQCVAAGINVKIIRDAGHTEIEPGSYTVLAVGPAPASVLDPICGALKPY